MKTSGWAVTDVGRKREHNEDSFLCNDEVGLYAVADGMGGHLGGEKASRMAVEIMEEEITRGISLGVTRTDEEVPVTNRISENPIAMAMRNAVNQTTQAIWRTAQVQPQYAGMGTTMTAILFHKGRATLCHVGDSRAYIFRNGQARQLTDDHSWIAEQIRAGVLAPDDIIASRFRNIITRSVGFEPTVEPDLITIPVEAGDCFLLCSDGLSNYLTAEDIAQVLQQEFFSEAPRVMTEMANARGGEDNITALAVYTGNR